jgi:hypothetical protein
MIISTLSALTYLPIEFMPPPLPVSNQVFPVVYAQPSRLVETGLIGRLTSFIFIGY